MKRNLEFANEVYVFYDKNAPGFKFYDRTPEPGSIEGELTGVPPKGVYYTREIETAYWDDEINKPNETVPVLYMDGSNEVTTIMVSFEEMEEILKKIEEAKKSRIDGQFIIDLRRIEKEVIDNSKEIDIRKYEKVIDNSKEIDIRKYEKVIDNSKETDIRKYEKVIDNSKETDIKNDKKKHLNKDELIALANLYNNKKDLINLDRDVIDKVLVDLVHCEDCDSCKKSLQTYMKLEVEIDEIIPRNYDMSAVEQFLDIMKENTFQVTMVNQDTMECNTFVVNRIDQKGNLIFDDGRNHIIDMPMNAFDLKNLYKFVIGENSEEYGSIFKPVNHDKPVKNNPYDGFVFVYDRGPVKIKPELVLEDESKMSPPGTSYPTMVRVINGEMEPVKEKDFDTIMKRYQALKALQKAGKENTVEENILEDDGFLR